MRQVLQSATIITKCDSTLSSSGGTIPARRCSSIGPYMAINTVQNTLSIIPRTTMKKASKGVKDVSLLSTT